MMGLSFQGASKEEMYQAVCNDKKLENEMRNSGVALEGAWEMMNFTNPEFIDRVNNSVNVTQFNYNILALMLCQLTKFFKIGYF